MNRTIRRLAEPAVVRPIHARVHRGGRHNKHMAPQSSWEVWEFVVESRDDFILRRGAVLTAYPKRLSGPNGDRSRPALPPPVEAAGDEEGLARGHLHPRRRRRLPHRCVDRAVGTDGRPERRCLLPGTSSSGRIAARAHARRSRRVHPLDAEARLPASSRGPSPIPPAARPAVVQERFVGRRASLDHFLAEETSGRSRKASASRDDRRRTKRRWRHAGSVRAAWNVRR